MHPLSCLEEINIIIEKTLTSALFICDSNRLGHHYSFYPDLFHVLFRGFSLLYGRRFSCCICILHVRVEFR